MKLKNLNKLRLISNQLLKTRFYYNNSKDININSSILSLKTALKIIFEYHNKNKKILFVGTPFKNTKQVNQLFKTTQHTVIPESVWVNGVLTNKKYCLKYLMHNKASKTKFFSKFLLTLREKHDLIVILNLESNLDSLNELYKTQLPIISFTDNTLNKNNDKISHKIVGNFNFTSKKRCNSFFFIILKATLKKLEK